MSDYSGKPLSDKLGLKVGMNIALVNVPANYDELIGEWPVGASVSRETLDETFDFIHAFYKVARELEQQFPHLVSHLDKKGMLWVSWPKGSSSVSTDLNENIIRELGLASGLVDVKVAAVDETWSGLKFVFRLKDR